MKDTKGKTVLVLDDEPDIRLYLETILRNAGFEVMLASNGKEALEILEKKTPDVISLDLVMPKTSGLQFFLHLQRSKDKSKIPIVVVSAHGKDEFGKKYLEKLMEEPRKCELYYLEKPVNPAVYLVTIRKALGLPARKRKTEEKAVRSRVQDMINMADKDKLEKIMKMLEVKGRGK